MYSSTPSRPITSSRGAADTTAGRIYFSIPSAQVRVPVGDLVFFDPHLCSHYTTRGKVIRERQQKGAAGVREEGGAIIIPGGRRWPKIRKKNPKIVEQCRKYPIPYLYTLSRTIPYLYTLNRTIPYLYTLNRSIAYIKTLSRTIPYLNTLSRNIPFVNTLSWTIPYLNTLSRTIPYLNTLSRTHPILIHWAELYHISIHWPELYPILIHWAELYPILRY